jgi:hypothetical protein
MQLLFLGCRAALWAANLVFSKQIHRCKNLLDRASWLLFVLEQRLWQAGRDSFRDSPYVLQNVTPTCN